MPLQKVRVVSGDLDATQSGTWTVQSVQSGDWSVKQDGAWTVSATQSGPWTVSAVQSGDWDIRNITGTVSLPTGAATAALQTAGNASLSSIDGKLPAQVGGRVPVDGSGVTQPVSAAALPLPTGAATSAAQTDGTQRTKITNGTDNAQVRQVSTQVVGTDYGVVTNAVIHGLNSGGGGTYVDVKVNPSGALTVEAAQADTWDVALADSALNDAFSRLRVSNPTTVFDSVQYYGDDALTWENSTTGAGAAVSFLSNESTIQMATGATTNGNKVIRQTRKNIRYQAGKSQLILLTFNFNSTVTNVRRRCGYFDASDGVIFEKSGSAVSFILRTSTSGVVSDANSVAQASWNIDPLNGSGPSGLTLDLTKANILVIDAQWLGVGRARVGFDIDGQIVWAHHFRNANANTTVYMKRGALPIRFEIENVGAAGSNAAMRQICCAVISEGGSETGKLRQFTHNNGVTAVSVTTRRPVLSIRAATTGPNSVRNIGALLPSRFDITAAANTALYEIVLNGTLTGAAWSAVDATYSLAEKDVSATAITGGVVVASGYAIAGSGASRGVKDTSLAQQLELVYSSLGSVQDTLTIVCTATSGTSSILSSAEWQEWGIA